MEMTEFETRAGELVRDPALGYDQKLRRLAALATEAIPYPPLSEPCRQALDKRIICDMFEGHAPYTARYILPDYEQALRQGALWDEVKDKLKQSALGLSGGQQQRLCIARAIAVRPEVLLMDEPCSALDPIATLKIEELITELKSEFTIVIVTHNMQQATRCSDRTAFFFLGLYL